MTDTNTQPANLDELMNLTWAELEQRLGAAKATPEPTRREMLGGIVDELVPFIFRLDWIQFLLGVSAVAQMNESIQWQREIDVREVALIEGLLDQYEGELRDLRDTVAEMREIIADQAASDDEGDGR